MYEVRQGVFVSDRKTADSMDLEPFDSIIALCYQPISDTTHHCPLADGFNRQQEFDEAVDIVVSEMECKTKILVYCNRGESRSPVVTATAIASVDGIPFSEALSKVNSDIGNPKPSEFLLWHANDYLGNKNLESYFDEYGLDMPSTGNGN